MDLSVIEKRIKTNVYHIHPDLKVPYHEHGTQDEIFYCIKGTGIGIVDGKEVELKPGDVMLAPAGAMHTLKTDKELYVTAVLIPVNRIICHCKQVSYGDIRKAMIEGARTVEDIQEMTGAGTECGNCIGDIKKILALACSCKMITMKTVVDAINDSSDTVEKLGALSGAGTDCGNCKLLLEKMIHAKR